MTRRMFHLSGCKPSHGSSTLTCSCFPADSRAVRGVALHMLTAVQSSVELNQLGCEWQALQVERMQDVQMSGSVGGSAECTGHGCVKAISPWLRLVRSVHLWEGLVPAACCVHQLDGVKSFPCDILNKGNSQFVLACVVLVFVDGATAIRPATGSCMYHRDGGQQQP